MDHPSQDQLATLGDGGRHERRRYAHVDRCVACRKALGALGATLAPPARRRGVRAPLVALALATVLALATLTPARTYAFGFVEIFEPHTLAIVPLSAEDLRQAGRAGQVAEFGSWRELIAPQHAARTDARAAQALAGFKLRGPGPASGYTTTSYDVTSPMLESFTFDAARARESARAGKLAYVPMPAGLDRSEVRLSFGSSVLAYYRTAAARDAADRRFSSGWGRPGRRVSGPPTIRGTVVIEHGRESRSSGWTESPGRDGVFVMQMPVPKVGSTGVSMATIERYLLAQPGVPSRLAAAFAALRDPTTTLPIPIPASHVYARPALVDGVWGTSIGDETGLGALYTWTRDGMLYAVGGAEPASEILAIANSLT